MKCPFCAYTESKVIDSRTSTEADLIRRRRSCEKCEKRFTTYERIEEVLPMVIKKDGRRETFDRLKVLQGLTRACEKRPVSMEVLDNLINDIERQLQETGEKEINSKWIGEIIMNKLHDIDAVAYVRFASVYRSFKDVNEFLSELEGVLKKR